MTRYSASRGIMYTAPPTNEETETASVDIEAESSESAAADD